MIIEFLTGVAKAVLGIKSTAATASVTSYGGFVVYGGLFLWFILIAAFIKIFNSAFKGSSSERMDPVEDVKKALKHQQKKQQQQQQRRTIQVDRVIKK
ncbi:hypothetical protein [Delftia acidovorans]|uniref:hypothetical protein n=1 Tax=Delftia acidovorans TaxID=80866 RepID=UPI0028E1B2DE|nr:hypothetical protein [Delftia acidovorans]